MFKDKELRKALHLAGVLSTNSPTGSYDVSYLLRNLVEPEDEYCPGNLPVRTNDLNSLAKRVQKLEQKLDALVELLAVNEVSPDNNLYLQKGSKKVVVGK